MNRVQDTARVSRKEPRSRSRRGITLGLLVAVCAIVAATVVPILYPSTIGFFSALGAPGFLVLLMAAYTAIPFVRDHHEPLIAWPAVMFLLGAMLILSILPQAQDSAFLYLVCGPVAAAILLGLASVVMLFMVVFASFGKEPFDFIHPILLAAMQGTHVTADRPTSVDIDLGPERFPDPARFASFLRRRHLVTMAHARRGHLTIRIARLHGLPHFWSVLILPFGQTVLRVDPRGVARIAVDRHVYRILDRPGPYAAYCRNIVDAYSNIAVSVAHGTYREATRSAAA